MKILIITIGGLLASQLATAQVGIGTSDPKKTLHINGSLQITNELNVGGDATTPGDSGMSGYFLKSNGSGQAPQWELSNSTKPTIIGTLGNVAYNIKDGEVRYTGSYITLPPGKYIITATMLIRMVSTAADPLDSVWIRSTFSDTTSEYIPDPSSTGATDISPYFTPSSDIVTAASYISGGILGAQDYNLANGNILINNRTAAAKTYFFKVYIASKGSSIIPPIENYGTAFWAENIIYAVPIND